MVFSLNYYSSNTLSPNPHRMTPKSFCKNHPKLFIDFLIYEIFTKYDRKINHKQVITHIIVQAMKYCKIVASEPNSWVYKAIINTNALGFKILVRKPSSKEVINEYFTSDESASGVALNSVFSEENNSWYARYKRYRAQAILIIWYATTEVSIRAPSHTQITRLCTTRAIPTHTAVSIPCILHLVSEFLSTMKKSGQGDIAARKLTEAIVI